MSSVLLGGPPSRSGAASQAPPAASPPASPASPARDQRNNTLTVIAGVGVLLLAMGVGVLIGRSGDSKQVAGTPQVITVGSAGANAGTGAAPAASFTSDWPAGSSGYTVRLQALPASSTVSAVEAAKAAASAKGAKAVGALKSEEFSSLTAGSYVIYSGDYHKKAEAEKALGALKKSFPSASVIDVSNGSESSAGEGSSSSGGSGAGASPTHPAPPSVLKSLHTGGSGSSYEQKSKNLPDVVETG